MNTTKDKCLCACVYVLRRQAPQENLKLMKNGFDELGDRTNQANEAWWNMMEIDEPCLTVRAHAESYGKM